MKKKETSQTALLLHINELKTRRKPKVNRMKELTKFRWEIKMKSSTEKNNRKD